MKSAVMNVVGSHFRPEFINRIDESVVFHRWRRTRSGHCRDPVAFALAIGCRSGNSV